MKKKNMEIKVSAKEDSNFPVEGRAMRLCRNNSVARRRIFSAPPSVLLFLSCRFRHRPAASPARSPRLRNLSAGSSFHRAGSEVLLAGVFAPGNKDAFKFIRRTLDVTAEQPFGCSAAEGVLEGWVLAGGKFVGKTTGASRWKIPYWYATSDFLFSSVYTFER